MSSYLPFLVIAALSFLPFLVIAALSFSVYVGSKVQEYFYRKHHIRYLPIWIIQSAYEKLEHLPKEKK